MCIPRDHMPQLDRKHLPAFVTWAKKRGVLVVPKALPPAMCHTKQCMVEPPLSISFRTLQKPVLVASDFVVVDGNNRWWHWLHNKQDPHILMPALQFTVPFREAVKLMFEFPATYAYGDGKVHPVKWE